MVHSSSTSSVHFLVALIVVRWTSCFSTIPGVPCIAFIHSLCFFVGEKRQKESESKWIGGGGGGGKREREREREREKQREREREREREKQRQRQRHRERQTKRTAKTKHSRCLQYIDKARSLAWLFEVICNTDIFCRVKSIMYSGNLSLACSHNIINLFTYKKSKCWNDPYLLDLQDFFTAISLT